jgi:predicted ATPase/DNA-binding CsgD family transcriptional regulator
LLDAGDLESYRASGVGQPHHRLTRSAQSAPLIGRAAELSDVTELLADPSVRLVSLTGRSGVGKTRLALEVAWVLDASRPGSVHAVSLASVGSPELVLAEIAAQLEVAMLPGISAANAVTGWLQRDALVLVLDNFEHLLGAATVLTDLLDACMGLQLLVTSQAPLKVRPERVVRVAPLRLPATLSADPSEAAQQPAVALYCDRATAANGQFRLDEGNVAAVVSLCRELEGLPLAIELAAARAVTFPAGELLTRLGRKRLDVLRSTRPDAPARHHDMRAAIGWTYNLLTTFESRLLRRLSVAGGAFEIEDAEALADGALAEVLDALATLVDFHLVNPTSADDLARFELAPSIRDFASEELKSSGEAAAIEMRWINWLAGRARSAGLALTAPSPDAWWTWLEASHDCLRNALQACLEAERAEAALDLMTALAPYWDARASHSAHSRLLDRAIELAETQDIRSAALAEALLWSGVIGIRVLVADGLDRYVDRLTRGEDLARVLEDDRLIMRALHCRVLTTAMTRDLKRGERAAIEGLDIARRRGDAYWISRFELHAARWAHATADDERALALGLSALDSARRAMDTRVVLEAAILLQTLVPKFEAAAAALPPPDELLRIARMTHQKLSEVLLLPVFALQSLAAGDAAAAARWCVACLEISGFDPSSYPTGFALFAAVEIASRHGDHEIAARVHGRLRDAQARLHAAMTPAYVAAHNAAIEGVRQVLGSPAFEEAVAVGAAQGWETIVTESMDFLHRLAEPAIAGPGPQSDMAEPSWRRPLTDRQLEVVRLLGDGLTNKEIAMRLGLTPKTVMHHTVSIYQRLGVRGRSETVAWAIRAGVAPDN